MDHVTLNFFPAPANPSIASFRIQPAWGYCKPYVEAELWANEWPFISAGKGFKYNYTAMVCSQTLNLGEACVFCERAAGSDCWEQLYTLGTDRIVWLPCLCPCRRYKVFLGPFWASFSLIQRERKGLALNSWCHLSHWLICNVTFDSVKSAAVKMFDFPYACVHFRQRATWPFHCTHVIGNARKWLKEWTKVYSLLQ